MTSINWNIMANARDPGAAFTDGIKAGQEQRQQATLRNALAALGSGGTDPQHMAAVWAHKPELAAKMEERQSTREFGAAIAQLYGGGGGVNALASPAPSSPAQGATNALLAPSGAAPDANRSPTPYAGGPGGSASAPGATAGPDRNSIIARAARANPEGTMEFLKEEAASKKAQLEMIQELNEGGLRLLGGVTDQASYTAARRQAAAMYAQFGFDPRQVLASIPEQYTPETVRRLQMQGMETKDQLTHALNEEKFAWQVEDGMQDNARDDRRIDVTMRGQDLSAETSRRNADLSAQTSRENRNDTPAVTTTNERGETVVAYPDGRVTTLRGSRDTRGGKGKSAAGGGFPEGTVIGNGKEKMIRRGGRWVPHS